MQTEGFVRAQRFDYKRWDDPAPWGPVTLWKQVDARQIMTVYEIEGDLETAMKGLEEFERKFQEATHPDGVHEPDRTTARIWLYSAASEPVEAAEARKEGLSFERDRAAAAALAGNRGSH